MPVPSGGPAARLGAEMYDGAKVRLAMRGLPSAGVRIELRRLEQSPDSGVLSPESVARGAAEAVADRETVAWLGGIESNTTALALPVLNASGVMAISPSAAATPLTMRDPGFPGAPTKYYPQVAIYGRTFARLAAPDTRVVGLALPVLLDRGTRSIYAVDAGDTDGVAFTSAWRQLSARAGVGFAGGETIVPGEVDWDEVVTRANESGADAIAWGSAPGSGATGLWSAVSRSGRPLSIVAGPAVAADELTSLPATAGGTRWFTGLLGDANSPAGTKEFRDEFERRTGRSPDPAAATAAAALDLAFDAIRAGLRTAGPTPRGDDLRGSVSRSLHAIRAVDSAIGKVAMDGRGDRVGAPVAEWMVTSGRLRLVKVLR